MTDLDLRSLMVAILHANGRSIKGAVAASSEIIEAVRASNPEAVLSEDRRRVATAWSSAIARKAREA